MPANTLVFRALLRAALPSLADVVRQTQAATVLDFGPVRLSSLGGLDLKDGLTSARTSAPSLAVCAFGLSLLSERELSSRLDALHAAADHAVFLDIKVAERNLELPSSLLLNGMRRFHRRPPEKPWSY